jgi:hypothetical protein
MTALAATLIDKLQRLSVQRLVEVEDFVDFLQTRELENADRRLVRVAAQTAEASFAAVWDNDEDAVYDRL